MTADELRKFFNDTYGLGEWPKSYVVDAVTYANVCQAVFKWANSNEVVNAIQFQDFSIIPVALGLNNGIMFRNVELILE